MGVLARLMPTAYSYLRYSSAAQGNGDSFRRQLEDTRAYAAQAGFTLDESLGVDRGLSGFTGENLVKGVLGSFLRNVACGKIRRGSVLIIENPDRLSRRKFGEVYSWIYSPLLSAGIELHFLRPQCVLRPGHSFIDLLQVGVEIDRAVSESAAKSSRLSKAWANKKRNSAPGVVITHKMPGWLEGKVGERMRVNDTRAAVVRTIFEWAAGGMGKRLIARRLNEQRIPPFGRGTHWISSSVAKILANRAVLGEFQPYKGRAGAKGNGTSPTGEGLKRVPDGPVRFDFFPSIVSPVLFKQARDSIASRTSPNAGGRAAALHNLFGGLLIDGNMGLAMYYIDRGRRDRPRLATSSKEIDGRRPHTIPYAEFEAAFLSFLDALDWSKVIGAVDSIEIKALEEKIAGLDLDITRSSRRTAVIVDELVDLPSPALRDRLRAEETALEAFESEREGAAKALEAAKARNRDLLNPSVVYLALAQAKDLETRAKLRAEIRKRVTSITFWFEREACSPRLVEDPVKGLFPFAEVAFANGQKRYIALLGNGSFVTLERSTVIISSGAGPR
jgi:hypothetical protein